MPCKDCGPIFENDRPRNSKTKQYEEKITFLEAALCASLEAQFRKFEYKDIYTIKTDGEIRELMLSDLDYDEAGITRNELTLWWFEHLEKDKKRRMLEEKNAIINRRKLEALEKLTAEEKQLLGLQ